MEDMSEAEKKYSILIHNIQIYHPKENFIFIFQ